MKSHFDLDDEAIAAAIEEKDVNANARKPGMIGIDSNILLRAIANDDTTQSPLARDFLSSLSASGPGVVNSVVLAEDRRPDWLLRTSRLRPPDAPGQVQRSRDRKAAGIPEEQLCTTSPDDCAAL